MGNGNPTPAWVTVIYRVTDPACTVIVPLLEYERLLAEAYTVKEPLFVPLDADTVSQLALLLTVHVALDVTVTDSVEYDDEGFHDEDESESVGDAADCVTLTVLLIEPLPVVATVMVPVLDKIEVFADAFIVNEPLLVPLDGDTVSQLVELLLTVHDVLDVTLMVVDALPLVGFHDEDDSVSVVDAPDCVTLSVLLTVPTPVVVDTVIVPDLDDVEVFAVADIVNEPLPEPLEDETLSQLVAPLLTLADQLALDVTVTDVFAAVDEGLHDELDSESVGETPSWVTLIIRVTDPARTVIVPALAATDVFAVAVIVIDELSDPLDCETLSQLVESLMTVHAVFEVTFMVLEPLVELVFHDVGETVNEVACWVTVIVALSVSVAIVIVPLLWDEAVFAEALRVSVPFPVALEGETESHPAAEPLTVAVHALFEVTETEVEELVAEGAQVVWDKDNFGTGAACCVTEIVKLVVPSETVIVPLLVDVNVFSLAVIVSCPSLVPFAGETDSQFAALLFTLAVHDEPECTSILVDSPENFGFHVVVDIVNTAAPFACCVTVTISLSVPAVTVIFSVRCAGVAFSLAVIVKLPSSVPLPGETASQLAESSLLAVHEVLQVTVTVVLPPAAIVFHVATDSINTGFSAACCVTFTVAVKVPAVTVTLPVLSASEEFSLAVMTIEPLPVPFDDETVIQFASLDAFHAELEVTAISVEAPLGIGLHSEIERARVGEACGCEARSINSIICLSRPNTNTDATSTAKTTITEREITKSLENFLFPDACRLEREFLLDTALLNFSTGFRVRLLLYELFFGRRFARDIESLC